VDVSFEVLTIRDSEFDDPTMYPVLGSRENLIEFDGFDGDDWQHFVATELKVHELRGGKLVTHVHDADIKAEVFITEGRVAVACEKYDKGGGWRGTSLTGMVALNAISHARAAVRRHGKMLVGHVRYPWLKAVGFTSKAGWATHEAIRLSLAEQVGGAERPLFLDITLPKGLDGRELARAVTRRCALYRLQHETLTESARLGFEALLDPPELEPIPKTFVFQAMPNYYFASPQTAYPKAHDAGDRSS
jgi:hypothetical protein